MKDHNLIGGGMMGLGMIRCERSSRNFTPMLGLSCKNDTTQTGQTMKKNKKVNYAAKLTRVMDDGTEVTVARQIISITPMRTITAREPTA